MNLSGAKRGDLKLNENAAKNQNRVQYGRWIVDEFNSLAEGKGGQLVDIADDLNWHSVWATAVCSVEPVEQVKFSGKLKLLRAGNLARRFRSSHSSKE